ncbi:MAG: hypothetical protein CSA04_04820 [Bacteroidetes bacterium]|nr:MAG: hypothetical protein CSA04_04820 [Bacteroidota bacterium]
MERKQLESKVINVLDQIRPYLLQDGGDLEFVELTDDNVVKVKLKGACGSCPYSRMTLKDGIERAVTQSLPEIKSVEEA